MATKPSKETSAQDFNMDKFKTQLAEVFKKSSFGRKASGRIELDLSVGSVSYMGSLKGGILSKEMLA